MVLPVVSSMLLCCFAVLFEKEIRPEASMPTFPFVFGTDGTLDTHAGTVLGFDEHTKCTLLCFVSLVEYCQIFLKLVSVDCIWNLRVKFVRE